MKDAAVRAATGKLDEQLQSSIRCGDGDGDVSSA